MPSPRLKIWGWTVERKVRASHLVYSTVIVVGTRHPGEVVARRSACGTTGHSLEFSGLQPDMVPCARCLQWQIRQRQRAAGQ